MAAFKWYLSFHLTYKEAMVQLCCRDFGDCAKYFFSASSTCNTSFHLSHAALGDTKTLMRTGPSSLLVALAHCANNYSSSFLTQLTRFVQFCSCCFWHR